MLQEIYRSVKREPLGKPYVRGHSKPEDPDFAFGVASASSEAAKSLLFPVDSVDTPEAQEQYKKSHACASSLSSSPRVVA
jgi:hypothetical protein